MNILVTGGVGYIGSHTVVELLENGHNISIVDNLVNSHRDSLSRIEKVTSTKIDFHEFDLRNTKKLTALFAEKSFDAVIHFAGLKAVGESVKKPLLYYRTNIDSTLSLLEVMETHDVRKLVFSSSATVYGIAPVPYQETSPAGQGITSPYGQTKYMIEQILIDTAVANDRNEFSILRYFNPIGAHESGLIGELPNGIPNNLMPFITQVASGQREKLSIFGNDYTTKDGTCERDYIHVIDLAKGHLAALEHMKPGSSVYNLGSGVGVSVLDLVNSFIAATGQEIPYSFETRRAGDLPAFWADPSKAARELNWKTEKSIEEACYDSWRWQQSIASR